MKNNKKKATSNKKNRRKQKQPKENIVDDNANEIKLAEDKSGFDRDYRKVLHDINNVIIDMNASLPERVNETSNQLDKENIESVPQPPQTKTLQPLELFLESIDSSETQLKVESPHSPNEHLPTHNTQLIEDVKDFYDGNSIIISLTDEGVYFEAIEDEAILKEYEQTFYATLKIVGDVPNKHKYEIFLLLYPMMAMAYMQMIFSHQVERATGFLEQAAKHLDGSYNRRIEKLRRIRSYDQLPERALELLASVDKVEMAMAHPTYCLYIHCVAEWTLGQQAKLLDHFAIRNYNEDMPVKEWKLSGQPQLESLEHSKVPMSRHSPLDRSQQPKIFMFETRQRFSKALCTTISNDLSMVAVGTSHNYVQICIGIDPMRLKTAHWRSDLVLHRHDGPVTSIAFAPSDRFMLSCSQDLTMRLWCVHSWNCLSTYTDHLCTYVTFAPRGFTFATASNDGIARVWGENRQPMLECKGHLADMKVCVFHESGHYLATGSDDCTVRIWHLYRSGQVRVFRGHRDSITALAYSKCGAYLISGSHDARIIVWDAIIGRSLRKLEFHTSPICAMAVDTDNNTLAVSGHNKLSCWDLQLLVSTVCEDEAEEDEVGTFSEPTTKELLHSSYDYLESPISCLAFIGPQFLLAVVGDPTAKDKTDNPKIEDNASVAEESDKDEGIGAGAAPS
ncbi:transcription initiation factor TFIID subunit 5-like [Drosophila guanche]|uniref:Blast:Transcription initiation factor TFIID subunit 5 n=1 Tax=Drosophila guanche TaxID=7266 RepID=A0A3B0K2N6_DROGU|nr:transcription initiation factor TFIID subunit 5-like [Drosophila guanche]SPP88494.1 blast:Transcription initiation factor TFIID subunit 5 [Drosophila guanche]